ncbi:MAG: molybdate ABC transporter substrate-binding protein [Gammaproteobacteria bacterium]|nr:molybdate ABC transporter substrate-binding protein [Gammaproteobacteria bacterium]
MNRLLILLLLSLLGFATHADTVRIAVAANFTAAMRELAEHFESASGYRTVVSFGSTGKLYTQIIHGAPFEVFLSADQDRPALLEQAGRASGRFTYATGRLVLWSQAAGQDLGPETLSTVPFNKLAIANPKIAPYGTAAVEVLTNLGVYEHVRPRLVIGDSVAQAHQFVATGNAELGLVALAQVSLSDQGSRWLVPETMHSPVRQDAVLLDRGGRNPVAAAFIEYLKSPEARAIVRRYGYETE